MLKISHSSKAAQTKLTFALPLDHPAGPVSVVGNFNDWTPGAHRLVKRANGTMSATVTLADTYIANFRYLGQDGVWFDEPEADYVDAGASVVLARGEDEGDAAHETGRQARREVRRPRPEVGRQAGRGRRRPALPAAPGQGLSPRRVRGPDGGPLPSSGPFSGLSLGE